MGWEAYLDLGPSGCGRRGFKVYGSICGHRSLSDPYLLFSVSSLLTPN